MNFDQLVTSMRELDGSLKRHVSKTANIGLTLRNWLVGAYIVEFEQNGAERAQYGDRLTFTLASQLKIKGLNARSLADCRLLHLNYPLILQTASAKSPHAILQTLSAIFDATEGRVRTPQALSGYFGNTPNLDDLVIPQARSVGSKRPDFAVDSGTLFQELSFSHFIELLRINDPLHRAFYEIECVKSGWSVRELKRQIGSLLFERLGLSTNKEKLLRMTADEIAPTNENGVR